MVPPGYQCNVVTAQWMASGKCATLRSLDLDSSDNVTEEMLGKFLERSDTKP